MLFLQQKRNPKCHIRKLEILGEIGTCRKTFLDSYKLFLYVGGGGESLYLLIKDSELGNICRFSIFFLTPLLILMKRRTISSFKGIM